MVTLRDIAEKANVTIATASIALSGRGRVAGRHQEPHPESCQ